MAKRRKKTVRKKQKSSMPKPLKWATIIFCVVCFCIAGYINSLTEKIGNDSTKNKTVTEDTIDASTEVVKNNETETNVIVLETEAISEKPETEAVALSEKVKQTEESQRTVSLNGRGRSDAGREEPNYKNVAGYVVIDEHSSSLKKNDSFVETPWMVPIYQKDKQFYEENGSVAHKTKIKVLSQELNHEGYGAYSGYVFVEEIESGEQYYIDVGNFVTDPYWEMSNLVEATHEGYYIAEYHQNSDYYPITKSQDKVELEDGFKVLVVGPTGTYGKGGPDRDTHPIEAVVFANWKYGYGGVDCYFNQTDLSIVY